MNGESVKPKRVFVIYKDTLANSIIADFSTFGFLILSYWVNYQFIGGGLFVKVILFFMWLTFVIAKVGPRQMVFTDKEQAKAYLDQEDK